MKIKYSLVLGSGLAALALCLPSTAPAKTKKESPTPSEETSPAAKKARALPFRGKVASVDAAAKSFTIAGKTSSRVIKITGETKITKQGAPAAMKDIVADEEVRGSYWKKDDGSLEARTVKLGPLSEEEMAKRKARKERRQEKKEQMEASPTPSPAS